MKSKNKISIILLTAVMTLLSFSACTDNFDDYNKDNYGVTDELKKADWLYLGGYIPQMEKSIYYNNSGGNWEFQIAQNLNGDLFSGYLVPPTPYNNDKNNANYFMMPGWNGFSFGLYNNNIMKPWSKIKELTLDKKEFLEVYGVALILKVAGMHRMTDLYGPIPYSKYGQGGVSSVYDSQADIYNQFFKELDEAVGYLDAHLKSDRKDVKALLKYDIIYKSDYNKWIKWANSLRLRLAIRISKVDPAKAKTEAEKAIAGGVITLNSENVKVPTATMGHPITIIAFDYNDTRMGADMQSILNGFKDPRISKYFSPATDKDPKIKDKYIGVRQGIYVVDKTLRVGYSNMGEMYNMDNRYITPIVLMQASEVYFLRAEGALRGWNMGGTAKDLYEQGIKTSFDYAAVSGADMYMNDATSVPTDYVDFKNANYNAPAASKITIKWDDAATNEIKLEKIITQKWIAMYPEGAEAWAEFRRTSYPKLFPIVENNSAGEISSTVMIRRLPYPDGEKSNNTTEVNKAIQMLGGKDSPGAKLWWDTNTGTSNF